MPHRDDLFAFAAVRDLLGLARALYRSERAAGAPPLRLERIHAAGRLLDEALDMGASAAPGSAEEREAWRKAEEGARLVSELVDLLLPAEPIVLAAMGAVNDAKRSPTNPRSAKKGQ